MTSMKIKQFLKQTLWFVLFLLLIAGCEEDHEPMVYPPTLVTSQPTGLTRFEAILTGTAVKNPASVAECKIGFLVSESSTLTLENAVEAVASTENNNQYSAVIEGLQSGKTYYYCIYASSGTSIAKGDVQEFQTLSSVPPVLGSTTASETTENSVLLGGELRDNGGHDVTERGFCYKIYTKEGDEPTEYDKKVKVAKDAKAFTVTATELKPQTTYIVRSYAVNQKGTGYGTSTTFITQEEKKPRIVCEAATEVSATTAHLTVSNVDDCGFEITERGFCFSIENPTPTTDNLKETLEEEDDFRITLEALSENTTYYVRAYAVNEKGTGYSNAIEFTTQKLQKATLGQPQITDITYTTAKVSATRDVPAETEVTEQGFCYSKLSTHPGIDGDHVTLSKDQTTLSATLTLDEGTRYYITAYAITRDGTYYSAAAQFSTSQTKTPTLEKPVAGGIDETFATITGQVTNNGGADIDEKGICWSDALHAPTVGNLKLEDSSEGSNINLRLTDLKAGTQYYVRAYAHNKNGYAYSETMEFTTKQTYKPTVEALSFSNIFETTAQVTAEVSSDGGTPITEQGVCYSTTTSTPTLDDSNVIATLNGTTLSANLDGLEKGTTYHVRAYAENKNGISYSPVRDLKTIRNSEPTVAALQTTVIGDDHATLQATIASNGGLEITERGFIYSQTIASPTLDDEEITILKSTDKTDIFSASMKGLPYTTLYYVRAYARNSIGVAYSSPIYFTTITSYVPSPNAPSVATESITAHEAIVTGSIANDGGAEVTETGFWYSPNATSEASEKNGIMVKASPTDANAEFSCKLEKLGTYTYYYVRTYARNKNGIAFSSSYATFTTLQADPDAGDNPTPDI